MKVAGKTYSQTRRSRAFEEISSIQRIFHNADTFIEVELFWEPPDFCGFYSSTNSATPWRGRFSRASALPWLT
jgi:hypothetical protein